MTSLLPGASTPILSELLEPGVPLVPGMIPVKILEDLNCIPGLYKMIFKISSHRGKYSRCQLSWLQFPKECNTNPSHGKGDSKAIIIPLAPGPKGVADPQ